MFVTHEGSVFSPDGKTNVDPAQVDALNAATDAREVERWKTKPADFCAYYTATVPAVTTWSGTFLGKVTAQHYSIMPNGSRILHIRVRGNNGVNYYGKFGDDWSQLVRLRKLKS